MEQQTAIEWLEEELAKNLKHIVQNADSDLMESLFEQAKQMEKGQIADAYNIGKVEANFPTEMLTNGEKFYKETYGN